MDEQGFWWYAAHFQYLEDIANEILHRINYGGATIDIDSYGLSKDDIKYINYKIQKMTK